MPLGRPPASLVNQQDRRIHDAVGQRLQAQGGKTCARLSWNDAATAGAVIEIFQDDAGIEQDRAVLQHQCRNLAQWILLPHAVGGVHGVGRFDPDLAVETEHAGADPDLANEGRGWGMTERQHGGGIDLWLRPP
jgi:hypothetical protein